MKRPPGCFLTQDLAEHKNILPNHYNTRPDVLGKKKLQYPSFSHISLQAYV